MCWLLTRHSTSSFSRPPLILSRRALGVIEDQMAPSGVLTQTVTEEGERLHHHAVEELLVIQTAVLDAARLAQVVIRLGALGQEVHV